MQSSKASFLRRDSLRIFLTDLKFHFLFYFFKFYLILRHYLVKSFYCKAEADMVKKIFTKFEEFL